MARDQLENLSSVMDRSIGHILSAGALPARRRGHLAAYAQRCSGETPTWLPGQIMTAPPAGPRMVRERWKETSSFDSSMVSPSSILVPRIELNVDPGAISARSSGPRAVMLSIRVSEGVI